MSRTSSLRRGLGRVIPRFAKKHLSAVFKLASVVVLRRQGYRSYLLAVLSEKLRLTRALGRPTSVTIEPANVCNLRCPVCETGAGILGRPAQMMTHEEFATILDKVGPTANHLMFYFMGESFLNPEAYQMIRTAREMGLYVTTCTNGEPIDPVALYESGINHVSFQIGGITPETHAVYRQGGDLDRALGVLSEYLRIIRDRGRRAGEHRVELGFIVMKHNEHEVDAFRRRAEEIGVDEAVVIAPTVRTPEQGDRFLTSSDEYWIFDRATFEREHRLVPVRYVPRNKCPWLYYAITIQVNGDVVCCCRDARGVHVMGNLLEQTLEEIWNGPRFRSFRRSVLKNQEGVDVCRLCSGYGRPKMY